MFRSASLGDSRSRSAWQLSDRPVR
uniref:Uncharacterized protein n=1 Tax=Arundo donax TaxID=35708 RepID=A0A0A9FHP7_ARUDO